MDRPAPHPHCGGRTPPCFRGLTDTFVSKGFEVQTAPDGETGLHLALTAPPDLLLLDIMLPKVNGYEVCRAIRQHSLDYPVIILTAKGQEEDIVLGLNLGADDYVTKPFKVRELVAPCPGLPPPPAGRLGNRHPLWASSNSTFPPTNSSARTGKWN